MEELALKDRIINALDFQFSALAYQMAMMMRPEVGMFKVGPALSIAAGPEIVNYLCRSTGLGVFLDLKFHHTPETVAAAAVAASRLGVSMFTIHCAGGVSMMEAAKVGVAEAMRLPAMRQQGIQRPKILGVTALTSQKPFDLEREGLLRLSEDAPERAYTEVFEEVIMRRALLAKEVGLDGVIVSPRFVKHVRQACGSGFLIVTPGIHMIHTAFEAISDGGDYLVIGRLFSQSRDPISIARQIAAEIAAAMAEKGTT